MVPTVMIHGSDGEVLAAAGTPGTLIKGKRQNILVTKISDDADTPLTVREALVGMVVSTIFTKEQLGKQFTSVPDGSRAAYACELIEQLDAAGKKDAANDLQIITSNEFDMYVFEPGIFELA